VSETYAREITTPELGCGLDGLLSTRAREHRLTGMLNGLDESWDPRTCEHLQIRFEPGDWKGKRANADYVRRELGLAVSRGPLLALVARLVHQKGVDIVTRAADTIVEAGGQIIIMGKGEPQIESAAQAASARHPDAVRAYIGYDDPRCRQILAGSDFLLMPSRFEPCGLTQMQAQRLGSLPIARSTGGLVDTIDDGKTGFLFREPTLESFLGAVLQAFSVFAVKRRLNRMRLRAMMHGFDWEYPAANYSSLYRQTLGNRPRPSLRAIACPEAFVCEPFRNSHRDDRLTNLAH
jgi:starch synthase